MESPLRDLEHRIARLESKLDAARNSQPGVNTRHRRTRQVHLGLWPVLVLVGFCIGNATAVETQGAKVTRVQAPFEVLDDNGKPILRVVADGKFRGVYALNARARPVALFGESAASGSGTLGVMNEASQGYAALDVADDIGMVTIGTTIGGPPLGFFGSAGIISKGPAVGEQAKPREGIAFRIQEANGTAVAELSNNAGKGGGMSLKIRTSEGKVVAGLGMSPGGSRGGALHIANGDAEILASVTADPAGSVNIFERGGKAVANMGAEADGRGFVRVGTRRDQEAASITATEAKGGFIQARHPNGMGVEIGTKTGTQTHGDVCASGKKVFCLSTAAAKTITPYW